MSRAVLLATLSMAVGIIIADSLFYENLIVPTWLNAVMWGLCLLLVLLALLCRGGDGRSLRQRVLFPLVVSLAFAVLGFAHYASYAADVQQSWQQMERPPVNRGNPDEFDYVRWRWIQGVEDSTSWMAQLRHRALSLRERMVASYSASGMDGEALSIVAAATLGDRSLLRHETRDLYAAAGASHLLALSGLHLGIIVGLLLTWLNGRLILSRWRPWFGLATLLFIWTYAFVAGLPTSLVRASLMTSVFVCGCLLRRGGSTLQWLLLTALLLLAVRPVYLFDVGAQLSFAAVAGIVVLHGRWRRWFFQRWRYLSFWLERYYLQWPLSAFSVSLAAQLTTLPLIVYYFHRIPAYAPLFNLVYIPLMTVVIYGSLFLLLLTLAASVMPIVAVAVPWLGRGLSWVVLAQLAVMRYEVTLPGAVVEDFWSRKAERMVVVYNNWRCPALHVIASPGQSWLLTPTPDSVDVGLRYVRESFWRRRLTAEPVVMADRQAIVLRGDVGFRAVMVDGASGYDNGVPPPAEAMEVDVLWITKGFRGGLLGWLTRAYRPKLVVLDAGLARWQRAALREAAERVGWSVYDVSEQGALKAAIRY